MSQNPKISVIVACYNHAHYLESSIESIINQTYENLEVIIVDDGSSDNSQEVMKKIGEKYPRIILVGLSENFGKWHALNVGVQMSSGEIITSHDADDVALQDRIERQHRCMVETNTIHNLCGFYHCWTEEDVNEHKDKRISGDLNVIMPELVKHFVLQGFRHPTINHYYTGAFETAGCSAMFYSNLWKLGMRFYPPDQDLRVINSEDSDFNFRMTALLGSTSILAEQLYCYRRTTSTNNEKK